MPAKEDKNSVVITNRLCLDTKSTHFKSTTIYNRIKRSTKNWNNILIRSMVHKKTSVFLDTPYAHSHGELLIMFKGTAYLTTRTIISKQRKQDKHKNTIRACIHICKNPHRSFCNK